jgi:F-type H+-transporting ATPase subunit alpha
MAEIKPAEISAILRKQVEGFESGATLEEVGTVLQVGDGIARVYLSNVQYGELVEFDNGLEAIVLNLEEDNVGVVLLGPSGIIKEGSTAKRTQRIASLKVGEQMVGRVVNTLGFQLMERTNWWDLYEMPLEKLLELSSVNQY